MTIVDQLIARLESLPAQARWPVFIPIDDSGRIQDGDGRGGTAEGRDGLWVEMIPPEVLELVKRRQAAGSQHNQTQIVPSASSDQDVRAPSTAGSTSKQTKSAQNEDQAGPRAALATLTDVASSSIGQLAEETTLPVPGSGPDPAASTAKATKRARLEEVLDRLVASDPALGGGAGRLRDQGVDESGLPIHEIRETPQGEIIGQVPPPTQPVATTVQGLGDDDEEDAETGEEQEDYWSAEAKARRAALTRRVFGEDSDLDSDSDSDDHEDEADEVTSATLRSTRSRSPPPPPSSNHSPPLSSSTFAPSPLAMSRTASRSPSRTPSPPLEGRHPARRPSATLPPPSRSILKPPPVRKKSVSFDESVPAPPESPDPALSGSAAAAKVGFPLPGIEVGAGDESEFGMRPVPVIPPPVPGVKRSPTSPSSSTGGSSGMFGGFARGFLNPPEKIKAGPATEPVSIPRAAVPSVVEQKGETSAAGSGGRKKPSLFAQRMAQQAVKENAPPPPISNATSSDAPRLPRAGDTGSTPNVKSSVVERPSESRGPRSANASTSTSLSTSTSASTSAPAVTAPSRSKARYTDYAADEEDEEVDDEDDLELDLGDDEEEEEDEYDLDDALLAREVALEYHKRQAYTSPYLTRDPDDPEYDRPPGSDPAFDPAILSPEQAERLGQGGVVLAVPSIDGTTGKPTIVNPTPDDLRRYVRVGKLENGNLVLAPGEKGWSDDEGDGEGVEGGGREGGKEGGGEEVGELELERRKKRENRERTRRVLLGMEEAPAQGISGGKLNGKPQTSTVTDVGLPPVVQPAPPEVEKPAVSGVKERNTVGENPAASPSEPKKVSRFKAARMA